MSCLQHSGGVGGDPRGRVCAAQERRRGRKGHAEHVPPQSLLATPALPPSRWRSTGGLRGGTASSHSKVSPAREGTVGELRETEVNSEVQSVNSDWAVSAEGQSVNSRVQSVNSWLQSANSEGQGVNSKEEQSVNLQGQPLNSL